MTPWVIAIARMLGLGTSAGLRPSLTLAVIGIMSNAGWGVHVNDAFGFLGHWLTVAILVVLALFESSFDKITKLDRIQDRLIAPYRLAGGAVAGAATIPFGWQGIVVGAVLGLFASWFAQYTKHITRPKSVPSQAVVTLLSLAEDLGTFLGSALTLAVPYFGYVPPAVSAAVYLRTGQRRRAKYRRFRRQAAAGRLQRRVPPHGTTAYEQTPRGATEAEGPPPGPPPDAPAPAGTDDGASDGETTGGNGATRREAPVETAARTAPPPRPAPLTPGGGDDDD
jgi:hypothetical protein